MKKFRPEFSSRAIKRYNINGKALYRVRLRIADIIIQIESMHKGEIPVRKNNRWLNHFAYYKESEKPHIILEVKMVNRLPRLNGARRIFLTTNPGSNKISWKLFKKSQRYILKTYDKNQKQHIVLNLVFRRGVVYILADGKKKKKWNVGDLIYNTLQIILLNYFPQIHGILVHATGLKDTDGRGIVFIGKSGTGKTTLARLWRKHTRGIILNDDRIIIRKKRGDFLAYNSPWYGDFDDPRIPETESVKVTNLLFIRHGRKNSLKPLSKSEACALLYSNTFPPFWDKEGLNKIIFFCNDLIENLPCHNLGFKKGRGIVNFVRNLKKGGG